MFNFFIRWKNKKASGNKSTEAKNGASEEVRTLDIHLGKVVLYQLSYARNKLERKITKEIPDKVSMGILKRLISNHRFLVNTFEGR